MYQLSTVMVYFERLYKVWQWTRQMRSQNLSTQLWPLWLFLEWLYWLKILRINQIYCLKGVIRTTRSQKYVQCTTETKSRVPWGKVSQAWHTVTLPTISSGPPSSWITRVCQYPQPEKLMVRPGIEPGSPAYMADALTFELLTTPVTMTGQTLTDGPQA